ncbi:hypothetical protein L873DRAFT_921260 [Choiromyces venosus 120613-1]|uniref:Uncharacterized protein n=1 Tax=Choiromyces venosus 120613-1 TaxID=1336337 RepID=A0A3N4JM86_9PEZI|nr:hypothetical protein L873DRAFT_921260 [Choiromyces venosus 120613-1]
MNKGRKKKKQRTPLSLWFDFLAVTMYEKRVLSCHGFLFFFKPFNGFSSGGVGYFAFLTGFFFLLFFFFFFPSAGGFILTGSHWVGKVTAHGVFFFFCTVFSLSSHNYFFFISCSGRPVCLCIIIIIIITKHELDFHSICTVHNLVFQHVQLGLFFLSFGGGLSYLSGFFFSSSVGLGGREKGGGFPFFQKKKKKTS